MLELKRLSVDDGLDIYTMLQEIPAEENGLINKANGLTFDEYKEWLIVKQRDSEQEGIVDGWKVPSTTFWLYADGIPVAGIFLFGFEWIWLYNTYIEKNWEKQEEISGTELHQRFVEKDMEKNCWDYCLMKRKKWE